jgi:hypothetical protein
MGTGKGVAKSFHAEAQNYTAAASHGLYVFRVDLPTGNGRHGAWRVGGLRRDAIHGLRDAINRAPTASHSSDVTPFDGIPGCHLGIDRLAVADDPHGCGAAYGG